MMRFTLMVPIEASNTSLVGSMEDIESNMLSVSQVEVPIKNYFSPGVYIREATLQEGTLAIGHMHKTQHLNIISKGACILIDPVTKELTDIVAPYTFESKAGVRKLIYVVSECVWSTVHSTEETDLDKLEEELITKSSTWIQNNKENK